MAFAATPLVLLTGTLILFLRWLLRRASENSLVPGIPSISIWRRSGPPSRDASKPWDGSEAAQMMDFLEQKCLELDTPILQLCTGLPTKPIIVMADAVECASLFSLLVSS
jgi:hypothetical protein